MTMKTLLLSLLTCVAVAEKQSHGMLSSGKAKMHSSDGDALLTHASIMKQKKKGHNMIQPKEGDAPALNIDVNGPAADGNVLLSKADTITQWPTGHNMIRSSSSAATLNVDVNGPGEDGNVLLSKADTITQWPTGHNMAQPKDGDVTLSSIEKPSDDGEVLWKVKPHMSEAKKYKPAKGKNMIQPKPGETVPTIEGTAMWTNSHEDVISKIESAKAHAKQVKKMKHEHIGKVNKALYDLRNDVDNIPHEGKIAG